MGYLTTSRCTSRKCAVRGVKSICHTLGRLTMTVEFRRQVGFTHYRSVEGPCQLRRPSPYQRTAAGDRSHRASVPRPAIQTQTTVFAAFTGQGLLARNSERQGRMIDHDETASMEQKKQEGYF